MHQDRSYTQSLSTPCMTSEQANVLSSLSTQRKRLWYAGESTPLALQAAATAFAPGSIDTFSVRAPTYDALTHIRLNHNGKGAQPDWLPEMVRIVQCQAGHKWLFFNQIRLCRSNGNQVVLKPGASVRLPRICMVVKTRDDNIGRFACTTRAS